VATSHAAFMVSRVSQEAADRVRADIEAGRAGPYTRTPGPGQAGGAR